MDVGPPGVSVAAFRGMVVMPEGLIVTLSPVEPAERVGPVPLENKKKVTDALGCFKINLLFIKFKGQCRYLSHEQGA